MFNVKDIKAVLPEDLEIKLRITEAKAGGKIVETQDLTVGQLEQKADYIRKMNEQGYRTIISYQDMKGRKYYLPVEERSRERGVNDDKKKVGSENERADKKFVTSWDYIKENFDKNDRLAIVMVNKEQNKTVQKFATAEKVASQDYQKYLRYMNANGYNIYVSMNPVKEGRAGRTKDDIKEVKHIYLDIDERGKQVLDNINKDVKEGKLPQPNYVLETSPGKYQVVWKAQGFSKEEAEKLMRTMASNYGTDKAATDVSRVLRIPGFQNKKYEQPVRVKAERFTGDVYTPEHFRVERKQEEGKGREWGDSKTKSKNDKTPVVVVKDNNKDKLKDKTNRSLSQSELDWYKIIDQVLARRNLKEIASGLIKERQDKPNPEYYSALTVAKAYAKVSADRGTDPEKVKKVIEKELKEFSPEIKNISENAVNHYYGNRGAERGR